MAGNEKRSELRVAKKELSLLGLCFLAAGLGLGFIQPLSIFLVTEQLGLPKENLQWLFMVNGIGMILGGAGVMIFAKRWHRRGYWPLECL